MDSDRSDIKKSIGNAGMEAEQQKQLNQANLGGQSLGPQKFSIM